MLLAEQTHIGLTVGACRRMLPPAARAARSAAASYHARVAADRYNAGFNGKAPLKPTLMTMRFKTAQGTS